MPIPQEKRPAKKYSIEDVEKAIDAVRREGISIAAAAKSFGIPKSTLQDKINGKYGLHAKSGRPCVLSSDEENLIVQWVVQMANRGFPVNKDQLISSVAKLVKDLERVNPFVDSIPGEKWYSLFLKRHPEISQRVTQLLTTSRASVTEEQIRNWFLEVKRYMEEKDLLTVFEDKKRIFNADETAFYLSPQGKKVLVKRGEKRVHTVSGNDEKECLTVLINANAAGDVVPPMVVFPYTRIPANIVNNFPDTWGIGKSESGWMTCETFFEYVTNVFHPWLVTNGITFPVVLFIDGHTSHLTYHLSDFCQKNQIELVALFPNATHVMQPLDVAVFSPLKSSWKKFVQKWRFENAGRKMRREEFSPLLNEVIKESLKKETIQNGFVSTGLANLDPDMIKYEKLLKKEDFSLLSQSAEMKLKEVKGHLHYFETKIGVDKVRKFASGQVDTTDESLYDLWNTINKDVADLTKKLEHAKAKKQRESEQNQNTTAKEVTEIEEGDSEVVDGDVIPVEIDDTIEANVADERIEDNVADVSGNNVIMEIENLLGMNSEEVIEDIGDLLNDEEGNILESTEDKQSTTEQHNFTNSDGIQVVAVEEHFQPQTNENVLEEIVNSIGGEEILERNAEPIEVIVDVTSDLAIGAPSKATPEKFSSPSNIPSPFKRSLFWPEPSTSNQKKRKMKERLPAVVTSQQYKEYLKKKEDEKKIKEEAKEKKRIEIELKRRIKQEGKSRDNNKKRKQPKTDDPASSDSDSDIYSSLDTVITDEERRCLTVNNWVVVPYMVNGDKEHFVGQIKSIQGDKLGIKFLERKGNKFAWPVEDDFDNDVPLADVVQVLTEPTLERRGFFSRSVKRSSPKSSLIHTKNDP